VSGTFALVVAVGLGQLGQGLLAAHAGQVGVLLPVLQGLLHRLLPFGVLQEPAADFPGVLQPAEGLLAQAPLLLGIELAGILALAGSRQESDTGSVVNALAASGGPGGEGVGVEADG
jgi:hypothetical protein